MKLKETLTKERGTSPGMYTATWLQWLGFITFAPIAFAFLTAPNFAGDDGLSIGLISLVIAAFFVPYRPYQKWLKVQGDALTKFVGNLFTGLFTIGAVLVVGGLILWGGWKLLAKTADVITPDEWTLMVCDDKLNYAECYNNSYVIPGFKSQKDCMLEGATRFASQGFECGSDCKDDYGVKVCKVICNKSGCSE